MTDSLINFSEGIACRKSNVYTLSNTVKVCRVREIDSVNAVWTPSFLKV